LTDDEAFAVLRKLVKSNEETLAASKGDAEKTATLTRENQLLSELLPKGLTPEEILGALEPVREAIRAAASEGQATGVAMKHLKGLGRTVNGADVSIAVRAMRA